MDFLRRHLFFMICGAVGAAAVALGVVGLQRMPAVQTEMQTVRRLSDQLNNVRTVNQGQLDAEQERIDALGDDRRQVFEKVRELYGYEPLVPDLFPNGNEVARSGFQRRYREAMEALMVRLNFGGPPSTLDVNAMQGEIENEQAERAELNTGRGASDEPQGSLVTVAGVLTRDGARDNAAARAAMSAAQRVFCYATDFAGVRFRGEAAPSLQFARSMEEASDLDAPELDAVWYAQVGYWIQKDVVDAIAAVNQEAADAQAEAGQNAWLGVMPIKEIISVRVLEGYVPDVGDPVRGSDPAGSDEAYPPGTPDSVFTHSGSTDWYDVVQYSVKLVMDVRDIPRFIDRMSADSFHTLLRVAYQVVPPNLGMVGKIYGSEPAVQVVMDFETIMLGEVFRPLMPTVVCDDYGIDCGAREEEEE